MGKYLVELDKVTVAIGGKTLLREVSLSVESGHIVTLIGPNGAGKTTLARSVLGLQKISTGHMHKQAGLRIGYVPQKLHIDSTLPLPVKRFLTLSGASVEQAAKALALVNAGHLLDTAIYALSGGENQRVLLARALLRAPQLLVLDEPAQGVDVNGQAELYQLIDQLADDLHCGVLLISHDLHLVMARTDTVVCLNQHVCCHGHPAKVTNDPAFLSLFGPAAATMAIYTHDHNHDHNLHGDVVCQHGDDEEHHHHA